MTKIFLIAMVGYLVFSLVNVGIMIFGSGEIANSAWGLRSGVTVMGIQLGVIIGALAVLLAAYSLVMDFDSIKRGVEAGVPGRYAWAAAFGLAVTLIWLYLELLRLLAILRSE